MADGRDLRRPAERLRLRLDAAARRRDVRHPPRGLSDKRAGLFPHRGLCGQGISDALRPVRYRRRRGVPEIRRRAHHPPLLCGRRDRHPHGRQRARHLDDGGDDDPRQAHGRQDPAGPPLRQPRARHGPAPPRAAPPRHLPPPRMRAGVHRGAVKAGAENPAPMACEPL